MVEPEDADWCPISPHMTLIVPHQLASNPTGLKVEQKSSSVEINSALKARTKDLERRSKSNDHPHFDQSALPDDQSVTPEKKAKKEIKRVKAKPRWAEHRAAKGVPALSERTWRGRSAVHCTWIRWKEHGHHASFVRAMIVCLRCARTAVPEEFGKIQRT